MDPTDGRIHRVSPDPLEPIAEEHVQERVGEQSSLAERALVNLLAGPFDKVSITMPSALKARIAARAVDMNFSAYVTDVLEREERRQSLIEFLDHMDDLHGPPTGAEIAEADRRWEEMWDRPESSEVSS